MSNWIIFASHSQIRNSCWNGTISFETFVETKISCCAPRFPLILTAKFHSFMLRSQESEILERRSRGSYILERSELDRIFYLQLRKPGGNDRVTILSNNSSDLTMECIKQRQTHNLLQSNEVELTLTKRKKFGSGKTTSLYIRWMRPSRRTLVAFQIQMTSISNTNNFNPNLRSFSRQRAKMD